MNGTGADEAFMRRALSLAWGQLGRTAPNPSVGCVIVADGVVVGEAATGDGGRPHAEETALYAAGDQATGATAYVTLEPCTMRSNGAVACAQRLVDAKVARVVIACQDPNPHAADGESLLRSAGVSVEMGCLRGDGERLNAGFFKLVRTGRPLLVVATSGDGFDAEFTPGPLEDFEQTLERHGAAGMTRVFVRAGTALAAELSARGLVDEA